MRIKFLIAAVYVAQGIGVALMTLGILPCAVFVAGMLIFEHAEDERKTLLQKGEQK